MTRNRPPLGLCLLVFGCLLACGSADEAIPTAAEFAAEQSEASAASEAAASREDAVQATAAAEGDEAILEESELEHGGTIEIREYSVAFIGSGSLGKGTLRIGDAAHPFRIGGLGIGGIGVAKIDAHGNVYNLRNLADFPGTYGKARLGATAADKGRGKLWLKNTRDVVLELSADMAGLALTGGVDGVVVKWESDESGLKNVQEGTKKAWEGTKKGTRKAVDAVKKPFE